jgi:tetratricopeptide (TPR) repeat protein
MKFLLCWLLATLLPVVGAILLLQEHDRYLYLPSFAFAVIVAKLLSKLRPHYAVGAGLALALVFACTTFTEEQYWETDRQIFTRATEIAPDLPKSWELLAHAYSDEGDDENALKILRNAYSRSPKNARLAYSLAEAYESRNDTDAAERFFYRTLELCGDDHFTRGNSLYELGIIRHKQQRYSEAESFFKQAIAVAPTSKDFHYSLASVLQAEGKTTEAAEELARERQIRSSKWN